MQFIPKCNFYFEMEGVVSKGKKFLSVLMASLICVHFSELVDIVQHRHAPHTIIEHTHAKILANKLEHQVS
jgi:hypothetical protein